MMSSFEISSLPDTDANTSSSLLLSKTTLLQTSTLSSLTSSILSQKITSWSAGRSGMSTMRTSEETVKISGSALNWWLADERRKRWPRLSQLAIDILSSPPMSDDPERVFSDTRRTISWERMQLGAETVEYTEYLKSWSSGGLLQKLLIVLMASTTFVGGAPIILTNVA